MYRVVANQLPVRQRLLGDGISRKLLSAQTTRLIDSRGRHAGNVTTSQPSGIGRFYLFPRVLIARIDVTYSSVFQNDDLQEKEDSSVRERERERVESLRETSMLEDRREPSNFQVRLRLSLEEWDRIVGRRSGEEGEGRRMEVARGNEGGGTVSGGLIS